MNALLIAASPSARSRSAALLDGAADALEHAGVAVRRLVLNELPAEALLRARTAEPLLRDALEQVARAGAIVLATPIYKAAYSGLLKTILDLLPLDALRGKTIVPLATGGSAAHLLALDYALKPVLAALGARDIRDAVFASDAQLPPDGASYVPVRELSERLDRVLADLLLPRTEPLPARSLPSPPRASVAAVVTGDLQRCPA